jgi:hypothetical protein
MTIRVRALSRDEAEELARMTRSRNLALGWSEVDPGFRTAG